MVRTPCRDKNGLKKGTWTQEEDRKLSAYIARYGCWNWRQLPKYAGLSRCGKSCRLRWLNYLRPNIKRGNYTKEEEDTILNLHKSLGNRWSAIAAQLPGRTDNEIKNHWHTNLKKSLKQNCVTYEERSKSKDLSKRETSLKRGAQPNDNNLLKAATTPILESSPVSSQPFSSSEHSSMTMDTTVVSSTNMVVEDNVSSLEAYLESSGNFWTEPFLGDNCYSYMASDFLIPLVDPDFFLPTSPGFDVQLLCPYGLNEELERLN